MRNFYKYFMIMCVLGTCVDTTFASTLDVDHNSSNPSKKKRRLSSNQGKSESAFAPEFANTSIGSEPFIQAKQSYGIPTYDALFKYVLDKPSLQPSFFHALAGLSVTEATRIDEHMNPLQELEALRTLINDQKTTRAFSSLKSKAGIAVSYQGKKGPKVHKNFTTFIESIIPYFDDLKRAFPKPRYDGTMDFVCKLSNGDYAMVEMQVIPYDYWDRRALGYVAAFYGKQMREGAQWKDIKRVIGINILGGGRDGLEHWKETPCEYMRHYKLQEQLHHPARYIDGIEIIQYSLMHTPQDVGDKEKQDWLRFFKEAHYMTETDVEEKITTPSVLEAFERAKLSTLPDRVREMYAMEEAQYAQYSIHTQEQIEKGKAEGIEIGKMQVLCNLIQSMKKQNKSDKKIKKHLDLSDEEFQALVGLID